MSALSITPFYGDFNSSNSYLVLNGSHAFLVDVGMVGTAERAIGEIERLALPVPEAVVLTHRHIDHVAGAAAVAEAFDIPVFAEESGAAALNSGDTISTGSALFGVALPAMLVKPLDVDSPSSYPFLEGFEVFRTPGHSEDSIVLFHRRGGALFSGDTVFANGGVGRWDLPTGDLAELRKSIDFLRALPVESLYPGHGPVVEHGGKFHIEESYRAIEAYI